MLKLHKNGVFIFLFIKKISPKCSQKTPNFYPKMGKLISCKKNDRFLGRYHMHRYSEQAIYNEWATYIQKLWNSGDIAALHQQLRKVPNYTFRVNNKVEINFKMVDDLLRYYNKGDITRTFHHIREHWGDGKGLNMPDGRRIINDQGLFIDIFSNDVKFKQSGLKLHLPIHVDDINTMDLIMRQIRHINPNFAYKYAPVNLGGDQFGKVLTIYAGEGLDTPEKLHQFTKELRDRMDLNRIRTYSPAELKKRHPQNNLLNENLEWKVKGAEGRIYYSYDGHVKNYNGPLRYGDAVDGNYQLAADGDRRHLKALNDPFEKIDLNKPYVSARQSRQQAVNNNHSNPKPNNQKEIIVGEGMGDSAKENVRELYERARKAGIYSEKRTKSRDIPSAYRLYLPDTPEVREFLNINLTSDRKTLLPRMVQVAESIKNPEQRKDFVKRAMEADIPVKTTGFPYPERIYMPDSSQTRDFLKKTLMPDGKSLVERVVFDGNENAVNELFERAKKEGLPVKKYRVTWHAEAYNTMAWRVEFENTPEAKAFYKKNITPDGKVMRDVASQTKTADTQNKQRTAQSNGQHGQRASKKNAQKTREANANSASDKKTREANTNSTSDKKTGTTPNSQKTDTEYFSIKTGDTQTAQEFYMRANDKGVKIQMAESPDGLFEIKIPNTPLGKDFVAANLTPDGTLVAPQVVEARTTMNKNITIKSTDLSYDNFQELKNRAQMADITFSELSELDPVTGQKAPSNIHFENNARTREFLEANLDASGRGLETPDRVLKKVESRKQFKVDKDFQYERVERQAKGRVIPDELEKPDVESSRIKDETPDVEASKVKGGDTKIYLEDSNAGKLIDTDIPDPSPKDAKRFINAARELGAALELGKMKAGATLGKVAKPVVKVAKTVGRVKTTATQKVVRGVESLPGGKKAVKSVRAFNRLSAKASGPLMLLSAALDPDGSREFMDDVIHLRAGKIFPEMLDGVVQMVSHPWDTGELMYQMASGAVKKRYEGDETFSDYAESTGEAIIDGFFNIGDVVWGVASSATDMNRQAWNFVREKLGMDLLTTDDISYEAYKRDPLKFLKNIVIPNTVNQETGLRSDDNLMTLITRDEPKAMEAYIKEDKEDVNRFIRGPYEDGDTPYDTALQFAVAHGNMRVASVLYRHPGANYNGFNSATGDTLLMTLLKGTEPHSSEPEYKTGIADTRSYSPKNKEKMQYRQLLIDDLINNKNVSIHVTNFEGKDAFMVAAEAGNLSAVTTLLEKGADINKTVNNGGNALHFCHHNRLMTKTLIDKGINVNHTDNKGKTPLVLALESGDKNLQSISMLLMATDEKGIEALKANKRCLLSLDQLMERTPNAKDIILMSDGYAIQSFFKERYPEDAARVERQKALQEQVLEPKNPTQDAVLDASVDGDMATDENLANAVVEDEQIDMGVSFKEANEDIETEQQDVQVVTKPKEKVVVRTYEEKSYTHAVSRLDKYAGEKISGIKLTTTENGTLNKALGNIKDIFEKDGYPHQEAEKQAQMIVYKLVMANKLYHPLRKVNGTDQTISDLLGKSHREILKEVTQDMTAEQKKALSPILKNLEEIISDDGYATVDVNQKGYSYKKGEKSGYIEKEIEVASKQSMPKEGVSDENPKINTSNALQQSATNITQEQKTETSTKTGPSVEYLPDC